MSLSYFAGRKEMIRRICELEAENRDLRNVIFANGGGSLESEENEEIGETVESLHLSVKTQRALENKYGCSYLEVGDTFTIKGLLTHRLSEVMRLRNFGAVAAKELVSALAERGLSLKPEETAEMREKMQNMLRN